LAEQITRKKVKARQGNRKTHPAIWHLGGTKDLAKDLADAKQHVRRVPVREHYAVPLPDRLVVVVEVERITCQHRRVAEIVMPPRLGEHVVPQLVRVPAKEMKLYDQLNTCQLRDRRI